ncbi:PIH1 domain-containing protein 1-like isoform X1 [Leptidea sinapis]|uniref:PIH1 domain-containing protein 1-like isoform X1 n=1 Tax=Leptidea sinapis TaxID=189913 RepID=UPI00213FBD9F|nr:PIH1 domain-containing protein 1-like isoform X1 [Leptidea sinapis]
MKKKSITLEVDPTILEKNMRILEDSPMEEELNKLFAPTDAIPCKIVKPTPGFCVKTFTKPDNKKMFLNVCVTDAIPSPRDITNEELMQILSSEDPSSYRVPMSIGEGRMEPDNSGVPATVYDVAVNPVFFSKIEKDDLFKTFFLTVVFEGLQDKYQFEIDMQKFTVLKNKKSLGTLQSHRIQIRDVKKCEESTKPLIEEINKTLPKENLNKEIDYRLRREPPTGEIEYLLAEFKIPDSVDVQDLNLEVGEDRVVLESKGIYNPVDFFLPCSVDQDVIDAKLDRNFNMLSVKMPVIH